MADAGYGLLLTTSDEPQNSADSATPQTGREARNLDSDCRLLLGYLVLASAVFLDVQNIQIINDPDHPEILQQWLPWFFGPGLTPAALVWSAWSQAIILPLLGALGMASCVLRCCSGSKSFMMEFASLIASFFIFLQIALWEGQLMKGLTEPPTEERQRWVIEPSWSGHIGLLWLTKEKLHLLGWESTATYSYWMWLFWLLLRLLLRWLKLGWGSWIGAAVAIGSWPFLIFATGLQAWALWAAAEEGSQFREIRKNWAGQVDREVFFLRCAAVLTIWDSVYMPLAEHFFVPMIGFAWYLAFDAFFMLITIHILGYEAETLEDLSDMARLQGKRVTFPGKVNPEAKDCIVSFPGKYSKDPWHPLAIL